MHERRYADLWRRGGIVLVAAILLAAVASTIYFVNRRYEHSLHPSQEIPWLASQLESEYLKTSEALRLYMLNGSVTHSDLLLRFEVYWSRVELMDQGFRFVDVENEIWKRVRPTLFRALKGLDSVISDPRFHETPEGRMAIQDHFGVSDDLDMLTQDAIRMVWMRNSELGRRAMNTVVATLAGCLVLLIFLAGAMYIMARKQKALALAEHEAKEQALASNRERERFMASMSHELRTPLNAIIGFSEIMRSQTFGPMDRKYREYADDIHVSGAHLLGLVNQLLDISSESDEGKRIIVSEFRIADALRDCVSMMTPLSAEKNLSLSLDIRKDLPVETSQQKFQQIVINLLSNAVKFTPDGGAIKVVLDAMTDGTTVVSVQDSGIGMAEDELSSVFNPFFRSTDPYVTSSEGAGLGLAISKQAAEQMGMGLDIESVPGRGTTAMLSIPVELVSPGRNQQLLLA